MKNLFIFILVTVSAAFAQQHYTYTPVDGKAKNLFKQSARAIEAAAKEGNTEAILRFAPSILNEFQNILLDPDCRELRVSYKTIQNIYNSVKFAGSLDSIQKTIALSYQNHKYAQCIEMYQSFMPRIVDMQNDSLIKFHKRFFVECCKQFFDSRPSFESIKALQSIQMLPESFIDSLKSSLELNDKSILLKLSTERNLDSLLAFKRRYPGLYDSEINNLILNFRSKWRMTIKRYPTIEGIESYLTVYADKDHLIDSLYEFTLFQDFRNKKTRNSAMKYLNNYPDGKFAEAIQDSVQTHDYSTRDTINVQDTTKNRPWRMVN